MMQMLRSVRQLVKVSVFCLAYLPLAALADAATFKASIEEVLTGNDMPQVAAETLYASRGIGLMYKSSGYQPLWNEQAIASPSRALDTRHQYLAEKSSTSSLTRRGPFHRAFSDAVLSSA